MQRTVWTPGDELGYPLLHSAGPQVVELGPVEGPELPRALEDLVFQARGRHARGTWCLAVRLRRRVRTSGWVYGFADRLSVRGVEGGS